jgi:tagaturonate epimerase
VYDNKKKGEREDNMLEIEKYSMGTGDRFAHQGKAQLKAFVKAKELGVDVAIVWNKSNREHTLIGTKPANVRIEAEEAVKALGWKGGYHVDADHIGLGNVDIFMEASDFFTLDVADYTGKKADQTSIDAFVAKYKKYVGKLTVAGIATPIDVTESKIRTIAEKYLFAVQEAGQIYRKIESAKGKGKFITEVSMDETDLPQTPEEMLFILAAIADQGIPAQTIAPKFTGRFNKGVDYVGNVAQFEKEFEEDVCVIAYAIKEFGLPKNLKLSVHSGSDKFSLYPGIKRIIKKHNTGLHLKTAGTTWLEEIIGLAETTDGLVLAKEIYKTAFTRFEELSKPYATVIDIDHKKLPSVAEVDAWSSEQFTSALRHDQKNPKYNINFRQLLHVSFKVAAEMGKRYTDALEKHEDIVAKNVAENVFDRHLKQIFI